ncbi:MAG: lanthionine synthetase C family protein [Deltaproteobacteria bacterium]|nr:lanthionine synthetase C family protein [Deltaproteobacteria bacterium]
MPDWVPLVTDAGERARIAGLVREIVDAVDAFPVDAGDHMDLVDRALLHAYVDGDAGAHLGRAVEALRQPPRGTGLYGGIPRVGWAVAHLTEGDDADAIIRAVLATTSGTTTDEYDLISGWVGWGVLALECGEAGGALARQVLAQLEETARPAPFGGVGWFTRPEQLTYSQVEQAPEGYWNFGIAHGSAGVIALLARMIVWEIEVERVRALLVPAVDGLIASADGGAFGRWWTTSSQRGRSVAWCYGDLGVAGAVLDAAAVMDNARWREAGVAAARRTAAIAAEHSGVVDAGLCHGQAGAAHVLARLYQRTGDPELAAAARRWLGNLLEERRTDPVAGFPVWRAYGPQGAGWEANTSLLEGASGVALALQAAIDERDPLWDRLLLVDA